MDIRILYVIYGIMSSLLISFFIRERMVSGLYSNVLKKMIRYFDIKNKILSEMMGFITLFLLVVTLFSIYLVPPWLVLLFTGSNNAESSSLIMGQIIGYVGILSISSRIKKK